MHDKREYRRADALIPGDMVIYNAFLPCLLLDVHKHMTYVALRLMKPNCCMFIIFRESEHHLCILPGTPL